MLDNFFILTEYSIKYIKEQSTFDGEFINKIKLFVDLINEVFPLLYIVPGQSDYVKNIIDTCTKTLQQEDRKKQINKEYPNLTLRFQDRQYALVFVEVQKCDV